MYMYMGIYVFTQSAEKCWQWAPEICRRLSSRAISTSQSARAKTKSLAPLAAWFASCREKSKNRLVEWSLYPESAQLTFAGNLPQSETHIGWVHKRLVNIEEADWDELFGTKKKRPRCTSTSQQIVRA